MPAHNGKGKNPFNLVIDVNELLGRTNLIRAKRLNKIGLG